ncbi:hypothetical protein [Streptomyces lavendulae]|uniref:hypothetical protein n=1 Tax=Streptomyces lavendulae TaxID=1914 RepID=UPI0036ECCFA8
MRRGSSERIVVGGMGLAVALALAGWGAGQVGYEPRRAAEPVALELAGEGFRGGL